MRDVRVITSFAAATAAMSALAAVGALLASCSPQVRDVAYYRAHQTERATQLEACRADRGRSSPTTDCINALAADGEETSRKFWTTPPPASRLQHRNTL